MAWAGPTELGAPHYYRLQGPQLPIEWDNTQRGANHAHSVWLLACWSGEGRWHRPWARATDRVGEVGAGLDEYRASGVQ